MSKIPISRGPGAEGFDQISGGYRTASGRIINPVFQGCELVRMTVGLAQWLLSLNTHNRKLCGSRVETYIDQFERGRWVLTNQGIGVDRNRTLIDGQHRLTAWLNQVELGQKAHWETYVITGLCDEARYKIDNGKSRSLEDGLKLAFNETARKGLVATVRILLGSIGEGYGAHGKPAFVTKTGLSKKIDVQDIVDYVLKHRDVLLAILDETEGKIKAPVVAALCQYAMKGYLAEAVQLATQINKGENLTALDPAYKVREFLQSKDGRQGGSKAAAEAYARAVSACCAHARGQTLAKLYAASSWAGLPVRREFQ